MDGKSVLKIRWYDKDKDKARILEELRADDDGCLRLGICGGNHDHVLKEADAYHATFVAEDYMSGSMLGFGTVSANCQFNQAILNHGYVFRSARRTGVARALLRYRINFAIQNWGCYNGITCDTIENAPMELLLASEGFQKSGYENAGWWRGRTPYRRVHWLRPTT